jgi:hypothetical protein
VAQSEADGKATLGPELNNCCILELLHPGTAASWRKFSEAVARIWTTA